MKPTGGNNASFRNPILAEQCENQIKPIKACVIMRQFTHRFRIFNPQLNVLAFFALQFTPMSNRALLCFI